MLRFISLLIFMALTMPIPFANAAESVPTPFKATYSVTYRGIKAGLLHFELRAIGDGRYIYETHATPGLVASLIVSKNAIERSIMRIDAEGVRPSFWSLDDGKSGREHDGELEFTWEKNRVRGIVEGKQVDLPTEQGLQDRLSFQIAAMTALLRGSEPGMIAMLAGNKIKVYGYSRKAPEHIGTQAGDYEAVLYESTRSGSKRLTRIWHAPTLGYIPIRAEQLNKGKVETVMELVTVERQGGNLN